LRNDSSHTLLKFGLGFIFVGLAFKVGSGAHSNFWTPDVYEGAPRAGDRAAVHWT